MQKVLLYLVVILFSRNIYAAELKCSSSGTKALFVNGSYFSDSEYFETNNKLIN